MKNEKKENNINKKILSNSIFFVLGVLSVIFCNLIFSGSISNSSQVREKNNNYHYINPLLECEIGNNISKGLVNFKSNLDSYVDKLVSSDKAHFIAVYFRDMNNGPWFGINENEEFVPASLLKVPIMISYLKESESDSNILNKKIIFTQKSNKNIPYFKADEIEIGKTYTIEELIERMITNSDNEAQNLLLLNSNSHQLDDVFKYLGVNLPKDKIVLTVSQYATFFRILFNASYLNHDNSEKALKLLGQSKFVNGLKNGLPEKIEISHKFGEKWSSQNEDKQLHDCGIIYYPNHPYLLCLMTRGDDFDQLARNISDISTFVYNEVDKQLK